MQIKFGPAGLGPVNEAIERLEEYHKLGFKACEIAFTYGAYIKNEKDATKIGEVAKKLGIKLSIHAHYWINLNSEDKEKVEASKQRILECLKIGTWLGAYRIVFHPGFYGKNTKEETYENIKKAIIEIKEEAEQKDYTPRLAPETTGKQNVFGSVDEIVQLVKDTRCSFCIDFAHIRARNNGKIDFDDVLEKFETLKAKDFHIHFSGIEYGDKGEKRHVKTPEHELEELIHELKKLEKEGKEIIVINESPDLIEDSKKSVEIYDE